NSQRVLCRLFGIVGDPRETEIRKRLWSLAEMLLPRRGSGQLNQSLMELGALVCTPVSPVCGECPLQLDCVAYRLGAQDRLPTRGTGKQFVAVREAAVVVRRDEKVLLVQRPESGRWPGMWEFPHEELRADEHHEQAAKRLLTELTGMSAAIGPELLTIRHGVTRFRITLVCFEARWLDGVFQSRFYTKSEWLLPAELANYPVSSPQRRLAKALV